jgi:hypothetical protein
MQISKHLDMQQRRFSFLDKCAHQSRRGAPYHRANGLAHADQSSNYYTTTYSNSLDGTIIFLFWHSFRASVILVFFQTYIY